MKIIGIIAEFNPFHNGHKYLISQARQITGCDFVVVAMSGDFVQRGAPAVFDKKLRTKVALNQGADVVLQLPVIASTASAELFALCGVATLAQAGVDTIVCGCETNNPKLLDKIATLLVEEPDSYCKCLQENLKKGLSFPLARSKAVSTYTNMPEAEAILSSPNNTLAIEYLKAIKLLDLSISLKLVTRIGVHHHDSEKNANFASATAIRQSIRNSELNMQRDTISAIGYELYQNYLHKFQPLFDDCFSKQLQYQLILLKDDGFTDYLDVTPNISNRIVTHLDKYENIIQFADLIHTKDCTYTRICRIFTHILLQITKKDGYLFSCPSIRYVPYLRILGFRKDATPLLRFIQNHSNKPVLLSVSRGNSSLSKEQLTFFKLDEKARNLYISQAGIHLGNDYQMSLVIEK